MWMSTWRCVRFIWRFTYTVESILKNKPSVCQIWPWDFGCTVPAFATIVCVLSRRFTVSLTGCMNKKSKSCKRAPRVCVREPLRLKPISCLFLQNGSPCETDLFCLDRVEECGFEWAPDLSSIFSAATLQKPLFFSFKCVQAGSGVRLWV